MLKVYSFIGLIILVLFQVSILPLNFAFMAIFAFSLYLEKFSILVWITIAAVVLAIFANLNIGLVLLSFTLTYLVLNLISNLIPNNQLAKLSLIVFSLFLTEVTVSFLERLIG